MLFRSEEARKLITDWRPDDHVGYAFDVNLHIPPELHDEWDLAPFARLDSDPTVLSKKQQETFKILKPTLGSRLVPFLGQQRIGLPVSVLQVLQMRGAVFEVVRAWQFAMSDVYKSGIERLYQARLDATTEVEKDTIKLVLNSRYGKMLENKGRRKNSAIYIDYDLWAQAARKPGSDFSWLNEKPFLGIAQRPRNRPNILDTPRYQGWWILGTSKALMYRAHYQIKMYYQLKGRRIRVLYMDTDSFLYEIETTTLEEDLEDMMANGGPGFNAKLLGHFKDEAAALCAKLSKKYGRKVTGRFVAYIGLAPKLYSLVFLTDCGETVQIVKAKGIPGFVLKKGEGFEGYKRQLENPEDNVVTYHRIMKHRQSTYLAETTRRGVCAVDTKTFRLEDNKHFHWVTGASSMSAEPSELFAHRKKRRRSKCQPDAQKP